MVMKVIAIFLSSSILSAIIAGIIWVRNLEKTLWNHGCCAECGTPWVKFDQDSQGGRGYTCNCHRHIWISYSVDKPPRPETKSKKPTALKPRTELS